MALARCNPCSCPSPVVVEVPGSPGADLTAIAPGVVDPEGVISATPGMTYVNTLTHSFWIKETGTGNTGWVQYIAPAA